MAQRIMAEKASSERAPIEYHENFELIKTLTQEQFDDAMPNFISELEKVGSAPSGSGMFHNYVGHTLNRIKIDKNFTLDDLRKSPYYIQSIFLKALKK